MFTTNGILIQGVQDKTNYVKSFSYQGMNAYFLYPLVSLSDNESRKITNEQQSKRCSDNLYMSQEFISNINLYKRYLKKCHELNIEIRVLFVESEYSDEIWQDELPQMFFLGYEYCPIPIDEQIITDLDWCDSLSYYRHRVNEYGLFDSYVDALEFAQDYSHRAKNGEIGDGAIDAYIFRVSQVIF